MSKINTKILFCKLFFLSLFLFGIISRAYPDDKLKELPIFTSQNLDYCVVKIRLMIDREGPDKMRDIGTGFLIYKGEKDIYLGSAGHVFKEALKILLDNKGKIVIYLNPESNNKSQKNILFYEIDLIDYWKKGLLVFSKDNNIDIGVLRFSQVSNNPKIETSNQETSKSQLVGKKESLATPSIPNFPIIAIIVTDDSSFIKFEDIQKAEDIYFFGYPVLPTIEQSDKEHYFDPIIRKGIVSKLIDGKKIVIEGFVSPGSSGSPVFARKISLIPGGQQITFKFIGLITSFVPVMLVSSNQPSLEYSGLAIIESVDNLLDTMKEFAKE